MEYLQMTIDEWVSTKAKLQAELLGIRKSFVKIGYYLRKIDDSKGYENDGYKSIADFAKGEYGLESYTVSRMMAVNREYSIGGYSENLMPEYENFKRSQLEEMLQLTVEDRSMIRPETQRTDIRELKTFNKTTPENGDVDDFRKLVERFFKENPEILEAVYESIGNTEAMKEAVNPSGSRSYRKGMYFLMMYERELRLKKFGQAPETHSWEEFFELMKEVFGEEPEILKEEPKELDPVEIAPAQISGTVPEKAAVSEVKKEERKAESSEKGTLEAAEQDKPAAEVLDRGAEEGKGVHEKPTKRAEPAAERDKTEEEEIAPAQIPRKSPEKQRLRDTADDQGEEKKKIVLQRVLGHYRQLKESMKQERYQSALLHASNLVKELREYLQ